MQEMNSAGWNEQISGFSKVWHQLLKLDQQMDSEQNYKEFLALNRNEINVISLVSDQPDVILKDISSALDLPKSTLTSIISRLERKGYILRIISQKDLRSYGLRLTERGIRAQKEHLEYEKEVFGAVLGTLEADERKELVRLMGKITVTLSRKQELKAK